MTKAIGLLLSALLLSIVFTLPQIARAQANDQALEATARVQLPPTAKAIGKGVFDLGEAVDPETGKKVKGKAIIRYNEVTTPTLDTTTTPVCYGYISPGAKWKTTERWYMNAKNTQGLSTSSLYDRMKRSVLKWHDAADGRMDSVRKTIFGSGTLTTTVLTPDHSQPDGKNETLFGSLEAGNAIAMTIVWGYWDVAESDREIVEWDMIFDQVDFRWSTSGSSTRMDFESIATHELGHAFGLADMYDGACYRETMYGYANVGETLKRSLYTNDIKGMDLLY